MNQLKTQFIEGCNKNEEFVKGCKEMGKEVNPLVDKIWGDWEAFASYAFNKSHSVLLRLYCLPDGIPEGSLSSRVYGSQLKL